MYGENFWKKPHILVIYYPLAAGKPQELWKEGSINISMTGKIWSI